MNVSYGTVLSEVLSEDHMEVIKVIDSPMEDKEISKELDFETSKIRTILNDLLVMNLVNLDRDRQDTGYCYYRWSRREDKIKEFVEKYLDGKIRELDESLSGEDEIVFECGCSRYDYGTAIEVGFTCPQCGQRLEEGNPAKGARKAKEEMKRFMALRNAS